jgi:hypothetical protein
LKFIYLFIAIRFTPGGSGQETCVKIGKGQLYIQKEKQYTKNYKNADYTK